MTETSTTGGPCKRELFQTNMYTSTVRGHAEEKNCRCDALSWWILEEDYDGVPREDVWDCMRKSGMVEKCMRVMV